MDNSLNNEPSLEKSNSAALWLKRTAALILWLAAFLSGVTALYGLNRAGSEPARRLIVGRGVVRYLFRRTTDRLVQVV